MSKMPDLRMASRPLSLTQLARTVGISAEDAQFYLDCGLLQNPRRRRGRDAAFAFHAEHIQRLHFVKRALSHGFSLEVIAQFVDPGRMMTCNDVHQIAVRQLQELRQAGDSNQATAAALEKLILTCGRMGGRKDCTIIAALEKGPNGSPLENPTGGT